MSSGISIELVHRVRELKLWDCKTRENTLIPEQLDICTWCLSLLPQLNRQRLQV